MNVTSLVTGKTFLVLLGAGMFGVLAVFPYVLTTQREVFNAMPLSIPVVLLVSLVQTTVLLSIVIFLGMHLGRKIGFGTPLLGEVLARNVSKEKLTLVISIGLKLGLLTGALIIAFDFVFQLFIDPITTVNAPLWQGFLAAFYGGIVEELLLRFFLMTLIVWVLWRFVQKGAGAPSNLVIWTAIIFAAVLFGLGHLPATATLTTITPLIVFRAIFLNGVGGVVFGWLYWKRGLEAAIVAHFTTDIVLLVIFPALLMVARFY